MKKKILLCLFALLVFVACGGTKQPEIYNLAEKEARFILATHDGDQKTLNQIQKDIETWKKLSQDGNQVAANEVKEWGIVMTFAQDSDYVENNYPSVVENFPHLIKK